MTRHPNRWLRVATSVGRGTLSVVLTLAAVSLCGVANADVFVLENGGRVDGKWLNADRKSDDEYRVLLASGGEATFAADQVRQVLRRRPAEVEYDEVAPSFDDTPEGQWRAAEWCRQRELKPLREHHLRRLIELDPHCSKAWIGLGYSQINGQWKRRADVAAENGYEFHQGKWRLAQEIELIEERQRVAAVQLDWRKRIAKWHELTYGRDRSSAEAHQQLAAIRDPLAVPALVHCLAIDRRANYRLFFIDLLNEIPAPAAFDAVVRASLGDPHIEVFHGAVDRIVKRKTPQLTELYCKALQDPNNAIVNRAAYVLGRFEDPSAVGPLIRALSTTHVYVSRPASAGRGQAMSITMPKDGSATQMVGPGQSAPTEPVVYSYRLANQEVLAALIKLTSNDFGYDEQAWLQWHAVRNRQQTPQLNFSQRK